MSPADATPQFKMGLELEMMLVVEKRVQADPTYDPELYVDEDESAHPRDSPWYMPSSDVTLTQLGYNDWSITKEFAVDNAWAAIDDKQEKMGTWSSGRIDDLDKFDTTQSCGLELVSRILDLPSRQEAEGAEHPTLTEIQGVVNAVTAGARDPFFCLSEVEIAGLHVHVGLEQPRTPVREPPAGIPFKRAQSEQDPLNQDAPKEESQHLAYILLEFEDIISSFHHPERRGHPHTKTDIQARSNRMGINGHSHVCAKPLPPLQTMRKSIFVEPRQGPDEHWSTDATRRDLVNRMGVDLGGSDYTVRTKFVNWTNLTNGWKPPTIEFRQHQGTLNSADIKQWVLFISALIHAADEMSRQPTPPPSPQCESWAERQGKKYQRFNLFASRQTTAEARMQDLFNLLGLSADQQSYWRSRAQRYDLANFPPKDRDRYESCHECDTIAAQDEFERNQRKNPGATSWDNAPIPKQLWNSRRWDEQNPPGSNHRIFDEDQLEQKRQERRRRQKRVAVSGWDDGQASGADNRNW